MGLSIQANLTCDMCKGMTTCTVNCAPASVPPVGVDVPGPEVITGLADYPDGWKVGLQGQDSVFYCPKCSVSQPGVPVQIVPAKPTEDILPDTVITHGPVVDIFVTQPTGPSQ